ncbi:unnamed protein product [Diamesa serratosioi]
MKNFLLFILVLSLISVALAQFTLRPPSPDRADSRIKAARICMRENKVKLDTIRKFRKGDFSNDDNSSKCFLKCFATKIGFFDKEGNIEMNYVHNALEEVVKDKEKVDEIVTKCSPVESEEPNTCEFAFSAYQCFWNESKETKKVFEDVELEIETELPTILQQQTENINKMQIRIKAARACIKETGTTWNTVLRFKRGDFTKDDQVSKCFMKCYANQVGLFDADGKVNTEFIQNYLDDLVEDKTKVKTLHSMYIILINLLLFPTDCRYHQ